MYNRNHSLIENDHSMSSHFAISFFFLNIGTFYSFIDYNHFKLILIATLKARKQRTFILCHAKTQSANVSVPAISYCTLTIMKSEHCIFWLEQWIVKTN